MATDSRRLFSSAAAIVNGAYSLSSRPSVRRRASTFKKKSNRPSSILSDLSDIWLICASRYWPTICGITILNFNCHKIGQIWILFFFAIFTKKFLLCGHGPLTWYVKWRIAHAPGMLGMFSPPPRVSDPDMHHGTWCMQGSLPSGFLWLSGVCKLLPWSHIFGPFLTRTIFFKKFPLDTHEA